MRRRLLQRLLLAPFFLAAPASARAQPKKARVGVVFYNVPMLELRGPAPQSPFARALVQGLSDRGWIVGENVEVHWRSSEGNHGRIPALVQELLEARIDVLVASGNDIAAESVKRSPGTAVVLGSSDFPVENKLVASLAKPGGSITGLTNWVGVALDSKRLALLKETAPAITRVAVLGPPEFGRMPAETINAAEALAVRLAFIPVGRIEDLPRAFEEATRVGANGLFVMDYPFAFVAANQAAINILAVKYRLPAMHSASTAANSGALLTFAPDVLASFRRAGYYVDKILRGAKPGELPIEQPARLDLTVNLAAARAIGLSIPASVLAQATRVINE
jgi:putative ABC transport system substrate-binding protein